MRVTGCDIGTGHEYVTARDGAAVSIDHKSTRLTTRKKRISNLNFPRKPPEGPGRYWLLLRPTKALVQRRKS